jgi:ribosomal protein S18 acetylase RimI-like enzyme
VTAAPPTLRAAQPQDVLSLASLHAASWRTAYRGIFPDPYLDAVSTEERRPKWERELADAESRVFVMDQAGTMLGLLAIGPARDPDDLGHPEVWSVYNLHVAPDHRSGGLGRQLMAQAIDVAASHGAAVLTLWVLAANQGARRFYERCGYALDGRTRAESFGGAMVDEVRYRGRLDQLRAATAHAAPSAAR